MRTKRSAALVAAAILAGCAGGDGGSSSNPNYNWDEPAGAGGMGTAIKVSYVWFPPPQQDPKTKQARYVHQYRYMISQGWKNKKGKRPHEPFERLYRDPWVADEGVQDAIMIELVKILEKTGLGRLRETTLAQIDLQKLRRIEQTNDVTAARRTRILTVETESWSKTVTYEDNDDSKGGPKGPMTKLFCDVELEALKVLMAYTIQTTIEHSSAIPK